MTPQDAGSLSCPKCGAPMRSYERNRVLVEQCTGCGGLFLDRGELESLVAAEQAWHAGQSAGPGAGEPRREERDDRRYDDRPRDDGRRYDDRPRDDDRRYDDRYRHGRKKKSFLSELFDD